MLIELDRFSTMCCVRESLDRFRDGSGWIEVDAMLCLAADSEAGVGTGVARRDDACAIVAALYCR